MHFPKAIFQLTIGIYCLEGCLVGLFLSTRSQNQHLHLTCVGVLIAAIFATSILHYRLRSVFIPIIKFMPISSYDVPDEIISYQTNQTSTSSETYPPSNNTSSSKIPSENINTVGSSKNIIQATSDSIHSAASRILLTKHSKSFGSLSPVNLSRNRSFSTGNNVGLDIYQIPDKNYQISSYYCHDCYKKNRSNRNSFTFKEDNKEGIPHQENSINNYGQIQQKFLNMNNEPVNTSVKYHYINSIHFSHPALYDRTPCIWVADDELGIARDQSLDIHQNYPYILFSTDGCMLDESGNVAVYKIPPDFHPTTKFSMYPQIR